jgi:1-acyl-sn-glycerol-3-phosphate acyltransferase
MALLFLACCQTVRVGLRVIAVLLFHFFNWTPAQKGRYIWNAVQHDWAQWLLDKFHIQVELRGMENVKDWKSPHVFQSNHSSFIDILVLIANLPNGRFVCGLTMMLILPLVGICAWLSEQIIVSRWNRRWDMGAIRRGRRRWPDSNLIFFPEGKRLNGLGPFKLGATAIAVENQLPIVPVAISGAEALEKGLAGLIRFSRLAARRTQPTVVTVTLCRELPVTGSTKKDVQHLTNLVRSIISNMLTAASLRRRT